VAADRRGRGKVQTERKHNVEKTSRTNPKKKKAALSKRGENKREGRGQWGKVLLGRRGTLLIFFNQTHRRA